MPLPLQATQTQWENTIGRLECDGEGGLEEPHLSYEVEFSAPFKEMQQANSSCAPSCRPDSPQLNTQSQSNSCEVVALLEEVHVLKQSASYSSRQTEEIKQLKNDQAFLRREMDDLKGKVEQLASQNEFICNQGAELREIIPRLDRVERFLTEVSSSDAVTQNCHSRNNFMRKRLSGRVLSLQQSSAITMDLYAISLEEIMESARTAQHDLPVLDVAVDDLCAQDNKFDFNETLWDIMPFCGLGVLSSIDQLSVVLVLIVNLAIQGCFIGLIYATMLDNHVGDDSIVTTLEKWRVLYGHNPDFANTFTDKPLALEICEGSFIRMHGASQADLYSVIDEYTQPFLGLPGGAIICSLSVFLWVLTCGSELKRMCLFFVGIWTPNDHSNKSLWQSSYNTSFIRVVDRPMMWLHGEARQKNYQLFITPKRALTLTIMVFLPRVIILTLLVGVGCLFLVRTLHVTELILNAVALDVVMRVDELLFDLFVPTAASRMVLKAMPLRVPRSRGVRKHVEPWFKMILVMIMMMAIGLIFLGPMLQKMNDVKTVMCGGDLSFQAVQLPFGPIVVSSTSSTSIDRSTYKYRAIYQRTKLASRSAGQHDLYLEGGAFDLSFERDLSHVVQLRKWRDQTIADVANLPVNHPLHMGCWDSFSYKSTRNASSKTAMMAGIGSIIGKESMGSCDDVQHVCFNDTTLRGKVARLLCPRKCGAHSSFSGLLLDTLEDGVPYRCHFVFVTSLKGARCADIRLSSLLKSSAWRNYADGFAAHFHVVFRDLSTVNNRVNVTHLDFLSNLLWEGMSTQGCSFFRKKILSFPHVSGSGGRFSRPISAGFCNPMDLNLHGRRSIRPFCPVTCQCDTTVKSFYMYSPSKQAARLESECPSTCFDP